MIRTAVRWNDIHTEEQSAAFAARAAEIYSRYPEFQVPELQTESLSTLSSPYLRIIYRTWPDAVAAQEWVDFLNSANLVHLESSAVIQE
jgi:hypothetical protein